MRGTLKGLSGVYVEVSFDGADDNTERVGLNQGVLQNFAELRLRTAGIRVWTKEEHKKDSATLRVRLAMYRRSEYRMEPFYAFHVNSELEQGVRLTRAPDIYVCTRTWESIGWLGISGEGKVSKMVRKEVGDTLDHFVNDYLAANPKQSSSYPPIHAYTDFMARAGDAEGERGRALQAAASNVD